MALSLGSVSRAEAKAKARSRAGGEAGVAAVLGAAPAGAVPRTRRAAAPHVRYVIVLLLPTIRVLRGRAGAPVPALPPASSLRARPRGLRACRGRSRPCV